MCVHQVIRTEGQVVNYMEKHGKVSLVIFGNCLTVFHSALKDYAYC